MEVVSIRWGILGCGDVAEKKSGPAFRNINGSELVAVMRRDASKAEDYARRHEVVSVQTFRLETGKFMRFEMILLQR